ncbi:MAG: mitochondrial fission ELM1 family protein, partial [Thiobacillus sp.]|nr:mitochondrial fission ELM1 family protein [Thiobacillus sp.]
IKDRGVGKAGHSLPFRNYGKASGAQGRPVRRRVRCGGRLCWGLAGGGPGADVGVFDLPVNPKSRVARAIAQLADAQRVTRFANWCAHGTLQPNTHPLAEADRCADWILKWLRRR